MEEQELALAAVLVMMMMLVDPLQQLVNLRPLSLLYVIAPTMRK